MEAVRAITATIVAVCISFGVGSLSAKSIEKRIVPDKRVAATARTTGSFVPEELVVPFALRCRPTTFGLELET